MNNVKEAQAEIMDGLEQVQEASKRLREIQLEDAYDNGFEAGVLATENGLGRA